MTSFSLLQALVFEPKKAFAELDARPRFLLPLLLALFCSVGIVVWYYQVVDIEWMTDKQVRMAQEALRNSPFAPPRLLNDEEIAARAKMAVEHRTQRTVMVGLGAAASVLIFRLLEAVYYLLAGKMTSTQRSFRHWMALGCWTGLPSLLSVIPAAVLLATATSAQIDQTQLQALSLNALFFHKEPADVGYSLLTNVNLLQFVGVFLAAAGVRIWSGRSWLFGILFAGLPMFLVYGVWALVTLGLQ